MLFSDNTFGEATCTRASAPLLQWFPYFCPCTDLRQSFVLRRAGTEVASNCRCPHWSSPTTVARFWCCTWHGGYPWYSDYTWRILLYPPEENRNSKRRVYRKINPYAIYNSMKAYISLQMAFRQLWIFKNAWPCYCYHYFSN